MNPIRVVHVASDDGWGGAERVLSILVPALARHPELAVEAVLLNAGQLSSILRDAGTKIRIVDERRHGPMGLPRELRDVLSQADVIHVHRYKEIALATLARRREQVCVATIHGLQPWDQMSLAQATKIWGALWMARLRGCSFVAVSNELATRLSRNLCIADVRRISNPLTTSSSQQSPRIDIRKHFGWESSRPLVGYAGRLEPVKGPDLLLQAATALDERVAIAFLGSGSLSQELRRSCEERRLSSRIGFLGEVADAREYLPQFNVLAVPSRHEGIPMIVLEAAEAGLPVAAFDVGGISELLTDPIATRCVPARNVPALAAAITGLLSDERAAHAAVGWGTRLSSRFSLSEIVSSYLDLYREVL